MDSEISTHTERERERGREGEPDVFLTDYASPYNISTISSITNRDDPNAETFSISTTKSEREREREGEMARSEELTQQEHKSTHPPINAVHVVDDPKRRPSPNGRPPSPPPPPDHPHPQIVPSGCRCVFR